MIKTTPNFKRERIVLIPSKWRMAVKRWRQPKVAQSDHQEFALARDLVTESGLFDAEWYLQKYPDVAASGADPLEHFLSHGGSEGRAAGPEFDSRWYVKRYPDAAASDTHPLVHFVREGAGRLTRRPYGIPGVKITPDDLDDAELILSTPLFDPAWYVSTQDLDLAPLEAAIHYLKIGAPSAFSPSLRFDAAAYLAANSDVRKVRANPLVHYLRYGREQGREIIDYVPFNNQIAPYSFDARETGHAEEQNTSRRITLVGNCQMRTVAMCLSAMLPRIQVHYTSPTPIVRGHKTVAESVGRPEVVFIQPVVKGDVREEIISRSGQVVRLPMLAFGGFHPDLTHAHHDGKGMRCLQGSEHSAIVLYAWMNGLDIDHTVDLFREDVFRSIGYLDSWNRHAHLFSSRETDIDLSHLLTKDRCFMLSLSHPRLEFCAGVARAICDYLNIEPVMRNIENVLVDDYVGQVVMPVYPEVASILGVPGEYAFKVGPGLVRPHETVGIYSLREFVEASFAGYEGLNPDLVSAPIFSDPQFLSLRDFMFAPANEIAPVSDPSQQFVEVLCDEALYDPG